MADPNMNMYVWFLTSTIGFVNAPEHFLCWLNTHVLPTSGVAP